MSGVSYSANVIDGDKSPVDIPHKSAAKDRFNTSRQHGY
jgi:hypothetical protein